jgi:hypothetical protein
MLSCEQVDALFIQSEQKVTEGLITKKLVQKNAYYGKIPDAGSFPLHSGTRIRGWRLGRIGVPNDEGWNGIEDGLCQTNACDFNPEVISHGSTDYFFSLVQRDLRTDWICLDSMQFRQFPEDEVMHLENGLRDASRYVHEEFRRSRYILFGLHKGISILPADGDGVPVVDFTSCDGQELVDNAFVFETRVNGEMDESHVRVCADPTAHGGTGIDFIGELTLDQLDIATERLEYEDDVYLDGTDLFDVLLPSKRLRNQLALQESSAMANAPAQVTTYDMIDLRQTYGTEGVLRNYSFRSDIHAMRFYPDVAFNTAMVAGIGYAFDPNDPNTWPRFVRVYPYKKTASRLTDGTQQGIDWVTNENYLKAPFGITTILNKRVMDVMSFPELTGVSSATTRESYSWEGIARWKNPDWECNVKRNKGFWMMNFRLAARPQRNEEGYSWFHRMSRNIRLRGLTCDLPTSSAELDYTPYCFNAFGSTDGSAVDSGIGVNVSQD